MAMNSSKNEGGKVIKCTCTADSRGNTAGAQFQDKQYGKGHRWGNKCSKGWRCTVCGREIDAK